MGCLLSCLACSAASCCVSKYLHKFSCYFGKPHHNNNNIKVLRAISVVGQLLVPNLLPLEESMYFSLS